LRKETREGHKLLEKGESGSAKNSSKISKKMSIKKKVTNLAAKRLKNTIMGESKKEEKTGSARSQHADTIVRNHVIWTMGAGFIPVLIADIFAVSALQLDMIRQLARVYDIDFSETQGKALVSSLTGTTLARITAGSLLKIIPGIGSFAGGATVSVFAGASTYALGEVFKKHFESGGTILDFDPARLKKVYKEKFEKGKKVAKEMREKQAEAEKTEAAAPVEEVAYQEPEIQEPVPVVSMEETAEEKGKRILAKLKEVSEMKDKGILTEEEFEKMKDKLIAQFTE